jgi:hypothetical protein
MDETINSSSDWVVTDRYVMDNFMDYPVVREHLDVPQSSTNTLTSTSFSDNVADDQPEVYNKPILVYDNENVVLTAPRGKLKLVVDNTIGE